MAIFFLFQSLYAQLEINMNVYVQKPNFAKKIQACNNDDDEHVQDFLNDWVQLGQESLLWDSLETATMYTDPDFPHYNLILMDVRYQPDCTFTDRQDMAAFKDNIIKR